jgi:phosphatidate cytidylyltransferase
MLVRWISALVGIPLFLGLCFWGREPFGLAVFLIALVALTELMTVWRKQGIRANLLVVSGGLVLPLYAWVNWLDGGIGQEWAKAMRAESLVFVGGAILFLAAVGEVLHAAKTGEMTAGRNLGYGMLGAWYISLFSGLAWLRAGTSPVRDGYFPHMESGVAYTLLTVFCVWAADSFALFAGKAFGKNKLAPLLSPGKTSEGFIGGLVAAVVFGTLFGMLFLKAPGLGACIGMVAGIFGQIGDLFESALKREADVKDFGGIMPGHGGVLDRFDSLLFVAPFACVVFNIAGRL